MTRLVGAAVRCSGKLLAVLVGLVAVAQAGLATGRTTVLVPLAAGPSWRDMAFLASIPAACAANSGAPSLVALASGGALGPEVEDYARRYRPTRVLLLGLGSSQIVFGGKVAEARVVGSAEQAATALSRTFWRSSRWVVLCSPDDYDSALIAAPLAALLKAPILYNGAQSATKETNGELSRLGVREVLEVGVKLRLSGSAPRKATELPTAQDVMAWCRRQRIRVPYLAAVNPLDRDRFVIRKLSLAGALLAAGRGGLVAPLRYSVEWKRPFADAPFSGNLPAGVPRSAATPKSGTISIGEYKAPFILTGDTQERDLRLSVDLDGKGICGAPLVSGDTVRIAGKTYAVSLGTRTSFGKTDVHLTWPTAERLCLDLRGYYKALGSPPDNLCLVGFPDAIPHAIFGHGGVVEEQVSDLPYSRTDDDPFASIGVARVVAENVSLATLYASRVLTYADLLSPDWSSRACASRWENTYRPLFENVGFAADYRHDTENVPWAVPPSNGKGGTRAASFGPDSPLARCAALTHADHSWWRELGSTFRWDASVLMAPTVVESGGCGTACLDREPENRSVVARLFRQGAAAFSGSTREEPAECEPVRQEFWNGVLSGESIGQAHKRGINSALLTVLDHKEDEGGVYRYSANIRMQFGDPAFVMHLPGKPKSAAAHTVVKGDVATVFAPQQWTPVEIVVPADWKIWAGKKLFVVRGPGAYALNDWCEEGYGKEEMLITAQFTTRRKVLRIEQVQTVAAPLGWKGAWYCQDNPDGSHTYRWAVRMIAFDQIRGRILDTVAKLDYRITYE